MELIWVGWCLLGMIMGVFIGAVLETEHDGHNDNHDHSDSDDRKRDGMDRHIPTPEEISTVLYLLRIGASQREKEVIDYLIEKEGNDAI